MKTAIWALALSLGLAGAVAADDDDALRLISVTGTGDVAAEPDMATIDLGVTRQDRDAAEAMAQAATAASAVLVRVAEAGIEPRDVQTSTVSLSPVWSDYRSSDTPRRITGYVARISVTVRVRALDTLGGVLDAVVQDGVTDLGGIRFGFAEPEPLLNDARRAAVADARAKADLLAEAAGVTLGALHRMSEQGSASPRPMAMEMSVARDAGVPIAPGEMSLRASVSLIYRIAD
jgi:uncharacterized protein YggE